MRIIPAIDIIEGKCVRLSQGDYNTKKVYNENPLEVAKSFEDNGITDLHLVDLDGAKAKRVVNLSVLEHITSQTNLKVDFGGGLRSNSDVDAVFNSGAAQITGGSIAVSNPGLFQAWLEKYGADKIILGADCLNRKIATNGWLNTSSMEVMDFIKIYQEKGIKSVISTDISKDGMLEGPSVNLYKEMIDQFDVNVIASGGVTSMYDIEQLNKIGCQGVIVGKALYEGLISLKEISLLC